VPHAARLPRFCTTTVCAPGATLAQKMCAAFCMCQLPAPSMSAALKKAI
jgi:hypothetical protein